MPAFLNQLDFIQIPNVEVQSSSIPDSTWTASSNGIALVVLHSVRIGADSTQRMLVHCGFQILESNPHHSGSGMSAHDWLRLSSVGNKWYSEFGQRMTCCTFSCYSPLKSLVAQLENQIDITVVLANHQIDSHLAERKANISWVDFSQPPFAFVKFQIVCPITTTSMASRSRLRHLL